MFKNLGLLSSIQCPSLLGSNPVDCQSSRTHCPFDHSSTTTNTSTSTSALELPTTATKDRFKDHIQTQNEKKESGSLPHSPPAVDALQPILKKARNAYQPNQSHHDITGGSDRRSEFGAGITSDSAPSTSTSGSGSGSGSGNGNGNAKGMENKKGKTDQDGWTTISSQNNNRPTSSMIPQLTFASHPKTSSITLSSRQSSLKSFYSTFSTIYQPLTSSTFSSMKCLGLKLLHDVSLEQEAEVFKTANKHSYRNACVTIVVGIKGRDLNRIKKFVKESIEIGKELYAFERERDISGLDPSLSTPSSSSSSTGSKSNSTSLSSSLNLQEKEELSMKLHLESCSELGIQSKVIMKRNQLSERKLNELTKQRLLKVNFLCPEFELSKWDFVTEKMVEGFGEDVIGGSKPTCESEIKICERCDHQFLVGIEGVETGEKGRECNYHWGKRVFDKIPSFSTKVQVWTCCSRPVDSGSSLGMTTCSVGPHVFKITDPLSLHLQESFITHSDSDLIRSDNSSKGKDDSEMKDDTIENKRKRLPQGKRKGKEKENNLPLDIAAMDCELSYSTQGLSLTRVTVLNELGEIVYDSLVRPNAEIIDFNTRFSGVNSEDFSSKKDGLPDLKEARRKVMQFVGKDTFLIGHGLENDLRALRLIHNRVIDTTMLFPHSKGLPFRQSLKYLTSKYLGKIIQTGSSLEGHSSAEDARMALELVRWKFINEPISPFNNTSFSSFSSNNSNSSPSLNNSSISNLNSPSLDSNIGNKNEVKTLFSTPSRDKIPTTSNPFSTISSASSFASSPTKPMDFFGSPKTSQNKVINLNSQNFSQGLKTKSKSSLAFIPSQPRKNVSIPERPSFKFSTNSNSNSNPNSTLPSNPFTLSGSLPPKSPKAMRLDSGSDSTGNSNGIVKQEEEKEWNQVWTEEQERLFLERKEKERKIQEGMSLVPLGKKK